MLCTFHVVPATPSLNTPLHLPLLGVPATQGSTLFPEDNPEAKKALARWMVAFARALRIHFQPEVTLESELASILTPKELDMLKV